AGFGKIDIWFAQWENNINLGFKLWPTLRTAIPTTFRANIMSIINASTATCAARRRRTISPATMMAAILTSSNSPNHPKKKRNARKRWRDARSKRSEITELEVRTRGPPREMGKLLPIHESAAQFFQCLLAGYILERFAIVWIQEAADDGFSGARQTDENRAGGFRFGA